jgi:hypothetical protein
LVHLKYDSIKTIFPHRSAYMSIPEEAGGLASFHYYMKTSKTVSKGAHRESQYSSNEIRAGSKNVLHILHHKSYSAASKVMTSSSYEPLNFLMKQNFAFRV